MMIEHGQAESLRSAREVLALTLEEARRGHPVELEGLVTVYGPRDDALSLQDLTGGIRVRGAAAASGETRFSLRQRVRVAGVTDTSFSPEIRAQSLQILGRALVSSPCIRTPGKCSTPRWIASGCVSGE